MRIQVHDAAKLKAYQEVAPSIIEKYNGRLLVRGGDVISLEGPDEKRRIVMVEFDSLEEAKAFYYSGEYANAMKLREGVADFEMIAMEGIH